MTDYILYHQVKPGVDCPDGIAAAWVAKRAYPNAEVYGCCYGDPCPVHPQKGDRLIIVDFSFPLTQIDKWIEQEIKIRLFDHHKTAQEDLSDSLGERFGEYVLKGFSPSFDMAECGATLTWRQLFPDRPMPAFLLHIRDRDLWDFAMEGTEEIHEAMAKMGRSFDLFDKLAEMSEAELLAYLKPIGEVLLKPKRERVKSIASRAVWEVFKHPSAKPNLPIDEDMLELHAIPVVHLAADGSEDRLTSDICSYLYKQLPETPFVACVTSDGSWSLRSDKHGNNTDVGAIAKTLGGGGHRNAAGFKPTP